jgi:hypothetical protein
MNQLAVAVIVPSNYWRPVSTENSSIVNDYIPNFGQAASGRQCGPCIHNSRALDITVAGLSPSLHSKLWAGTSSTSPASYPVPRRGPPSASILIVLPGPWTLSWPTSMSFGSCPLQNEWIQQVHLHSFCRRNDFIHCTHERHFLLSTEWSCLFTKLPTAPKISISSVIQQRSKSEEPNLHCLGSILRDYASLSYKGTQLKLQNFSTDNPNQTMIATRLRVPS